jgi:hypothetical protein
VKKSRLFFFIILFFLAEKSFAQCYYAFKDTMNSWQSWIFEKGEFIIAETQESSGWKMGWDYAVYIDKFENFNFFRNGVKSKIQPFRPQTYYATDHLLLWTNNGGIVNVFGNGKNKQLGRWAGAFAWGDSVVAFTDNFNYFQVYYNDTVVPIGNYTIEQVKASDNIVAYFTGNQLFNAFYRGEIYNLDDGFPPASFEVNRNIVAFVDYLGIFKVFWNGNIYDVASFQPSQYITGENFVVFISPLNEFKVFYQGEVIELLPYKPAHFEVIENILIYSDRGNFFHAFYKGKDEILEYFIPTSYKADNNMLVYPHFDGYLYAFENGVKKRIGERVAKYFEVHNNTVFYWQNPSEIFIYCNGKNYSKQLGY